jgi:dTDP-4-dehydrorhamnose 3,5-epimerase
VQIIQMNLLSLWQNITKDNMEYEETSIKGVWILTPKVFNDNRGYFFEAWKKSDFEAHVGKVDFIQDNESKSSYGVLRGLHYQKGEYSQAKLVRVIKGKVLDVAVDLRKSSPTFGKHVMVELSEDNKRQLFIPRGFAHGFLVLSPEAIFTYKVDNIYAPAHEASIRWNDPQIGINWPIDQKDVVTSPKDLEGKDFKDADFFE